MSRIAVSSLSSAPGRGRLITLWILQILAALAFLGAGGAKLAGVPEMVAAFSKLGVGQWFRYFTGLLEIAGAIGLFLPRYAFYAAAMLAVVMVGAVIAHLAILGGSPVAPLLLLVLTATIAYLCRR